MKAKQHVTITFALSAMLLHCSKDDGNSETAAATDPSIASGAQPDGSSGAWRNTPPPDITPPVAVASFGVSTGAGLGLTTLSVGYPADHSDYAKIDFRRSMGATAPADCENGDLALTVTDFKKKSFTDSGLFPGEEYSYRACIYDVAGNVISASGLSTAKAGADQRLFVTSEAFDGNLAADYGGHSFESAIEGADFRCQDLADKAELDGKWLAVISTKPNTSAFVRIPVYGKIYNLATVAELLAGSKSELWGGRLKHAVLYDEKSTAVTADSDEYVWSGSYQTGELIASSSCQGFTSNESSDYGYAGNSINGTDMGDWFLAISSPCDMPHRLYCAETYGGTIKTPTIAAAASATDGTVDVTLTFDDDSSLLGSVKLLRQKGKASINMACDETETSMTGKFINFFNGSKETPFETQVVADVTGADGIYNYALCIYDKSGNLVQLENSGAVTTGTDFNRAFVTTTTFNGNLDTGGGGVAGANAKCQAAAAAVPLTGTWKAIIADGTNNVANNISVTKNTYDFDGNFVAKQTYDLTSSGSLGYLAIANYETGAAVAAGVQAWTGSTYYGSVSGSSCTNWTSAMAGVSGTYGERLSENYGGWIQRATDTCDLLKHLYCIQQ